MKPANTDILQCTVVGQHASQCEIIAKTVSILGSAEAVNWLNRHYDRHDVLWITREGTFILEGLRQRLLNAGLDSTRIIVSA